MNLLKTELTNEEIDEVIGEDELDKALNKLKIALIEPDFIKTLILIWVVMAGTIFVLWVGGELK